MCFTLKRMFSFSFLKRKVNPIFILGSGRSGTHLLARAFMNQPDTDVFIENHKLFNIVSNFVSGYNTTEYRETDIIAMYKKILDSSKTKWLVDKTHPAIWLVDTLVAAFPNARFVGIHRGVLATVNSMLQHSEVMLWYNKLPLNGVNRFLGITDENKDYFESLPLEVKCACRVLAHTQRLLSLKKQYPTIVYLVQYNDFYTQQNKVLHELSSFLKWHDTLRLEPLHNDGLDKWKTELTTEQIEHITQYVRAQGMEEYLY